MRLGTSLASVRPSEDSTIASARRRSGSAAAYAYWSAYRSPLSLSRAATSRLASGRRADAGVPEATAAEEQQGRDARGRGAGGDSRVFVDVELDDMCAARAATPRSQPPHPQQWRLETDRGARHMIDRSAFVAPSPLAVHALE